MSNRSENIGGVQDLTRTPFTMIDTYIARSKNFPLHEKMVYIILKSYANARSENAEAWPGMKRIAEEAGMSVRKARDCIRTLEDMKLVRTVFRENQSNLYQLIPDGLGLLTSAGDADGRSRRPPRQEMPPNKIQFNKNHINADSSAGDIPERFERIWKQYPNKKGKANALKAYRKYVKEGVKDEDIIQGIEAYVRYCQVNQTGKQFMKHGSTFFNEQAWQDDWSTDGQAPQAAAQPVPQYAEYVPDYSAGEGEW